MLRLNRAISAIHRNANVKRVYCSYPNEPFHFACRYAYNGTTYRLLHTATLNKSTVRRRALGSHDTNERFISAEELPRG
jgi:hypothetical protein